MGEKIITHVPAAEKFCETFVPNGKTWQENFHQTMIAFAKEHVAAALKDVSENEILNDYIEKKIL